MDAGEEHMYVGDRWRCDGFNEVVVGLGGVRSEANVSSGRVYGCYEWELGHNSAGPGVGVDGYEVGETPSNRVKEIGAEPVVWKESQLRSYLSVGL